MDKKNNFIFDDVNKKVTVTIKDIILDKMIMEYEYTELDESVAFSDIFIIKNSSFNTKLSKKINYTNLELKSNIDFEEIRQELLEQYEKYSYYRNENIVTGIDSTENYEEEFSNYELSTEIYSPEDIDYSVKNFPAITIYNYISGFDGTEDPTIDMSPDFQRNFVWSNKDKSLLIESILLNIPIPAIYLNSTKERTYIPADGLQRLNAIHTFMKGELRLSGLEYLSDLNGLKYTSEDPERQIPTHYKRFFRDYNITAYVIGEKTPNKVKLDIFKRLNTRGKALTHQELRNSITEKNIRSLYKGIESNPNFTKLVSENVNTNRFVHHEFILRYFGAYFTQKDRKLLYRGSTSELLDQVLDFISEPSTDYNEALNNYFSALDKCNILFSKEAFRKPPGKVRSSINSLLYSQLLIVINDYHVDLNQKTLIKEFHDFISHDSDLQLNISSGTNNIRNINFVNSRINDFLSKYLRRCNDELENYKL